MGKEEEEEMIKYIIREDDRIERVCKHGVGHTVYNPHNWGKWSKSHGCCEKGCCEKYWVNYIIADVDVVVV